MSSSERGHLDVALRRDLTLNLSWGECNETPNCPLSFNRSDTCMLWMDSMRFLSVVDSLSSSVWGAFRGAGFGCLWCDRLDLRLVGKIPCVHVHLAPLRTRQLPASRGPAR